MAKSKYITTRKIIGVKVIPIGSVLELTEEQANHPLYRTRVRKADSTVQLEAASPAASTGEKERKGKIIAKLKELKIDFDGRKNADELGALLPPDELKALFPTE